MISSTRRRAARELPFRLLKGSEKSKATLSAVTTGTWLAAVILGICLYNGRPDAGVQLPLVKYDKVLRKCGPLLPFLVVAIRLIAQWKPGTITFPNLGRSDANPVYLYVGITASRILIYLAHLQVQKYGFASILQLPTSDKGQLMSDHIVLGASMIAILQVESIILQQAYISNPEMFGRGSKSIVKDKRSAWSTFGLLVSGFFLMALFGATCADMFYTALYFHPQIQCSIALAVGFVAFQLPAVLWAQYRL